MKAIGLFRDALRAKRRFGVGLSRQAVEATRLRWGPNRLDPWEYYFFDVCAPHFSPAEKRRFIGWRRELELDRLLNAGAERDIANDKLAFSAHLQDSGLPLARIDAAYDPGGAAPEGVQRLADVGEAHRWLTSAATYPLFVKPVRGARGWRARVLHDRGDGAQFIADLAADLAADAARAYLFQEQLRTHAKIASLCGDRLTSVRLVLFVGGGEPQPLSAVWRIPTGTNETDNFSVGVSGNLIAAVDLETGAIGNCVQGVGWRNRPLDRHPDTGAALPGHKLPEWRNAVKTCLSAAGRFRQLRLQHWDVALTDRGPVLLELNVEGGLRTHQIVTPGPALLRPLDKIGR
ncbi:MAG: sugar-transfer associated ATP-grasp domain-containing protein [Gammaproteobacteria bacterium]